LKQQLLQAKGITIDKTIRFPGLILSYDWFQLQAVVSWLVTGSSSSDVVTVLWLEGKNNQAHSN